MHLVTEEIREQQEVFLAYSRYNKKKIAKSDYMFSLDTPFAPVLNKKLNPNYCIKRPANFHQIFPENHHTTQDQDVGPCIINSLSHIYKKCYSKLAQILFEEGSLVFILNHICQLKYNQYKHKNNCLVSQVKKIFNKNSSQYSKVNLFAKYDKFYCWCIQPRLLNVHSWLAEYCRMKNGLWQYLLKNFGFIKHFHNMLLCLILKINHI